MEYRFYGWQSADIKPVNEKWKDIENPRMLYDILTKLWSADTCAPRMRDEWSEDNKTLGQCSITAFLVQDIFGGEVYGIPREGGNYHCYNVAGERTFDLTSEQFGDEELIYDNKYLQSRQEHFKKSEKYERYKILSERLADYLLK